MQFQCLITCKIEYEITATSGGQVEIVVLWESGGRDSTCPLNLFFFLFFVVRLFYLQVSFYQTNEILKSIVILPKIRKLLFVT